MDSYLPWGVYQFNETYLFIILLYQYQACVILASSGLERNQCSLSTVDPSFGLKTLVKMIYRAVVLVFMCTIYVVDHCDSYCLIMNDGCSVPLSAPFPYKSDFRPACRKHDVCYRCVSASFSFFPNSPSFDEDVHLSCLYFPIGFLYFFIDISLNRKSSQNYAECAFLLQPINAFDKPLLF